MSDVDPVEHEFVGLPQPLKLTKPNSYFFYGLHLSSDWKLPYSGSVSADPGFGTIRLREAESAAFVDARRGALHGDADQPWRQYTRLPDGADYLRWSGLFEFLVASDGRQILGRALNGTPAESLHTYLLGQVVSHALLKLGIEPLHATAIVLDGRAVAFMGDCGRGKSSLAASFLTQGFSLLTDDLLTVEATARGIVAHPGPPRIKLFPEMAAALFGRDSTGFPMNPLTSKAVIPLKPHQSCSEAMPLGTIYVLAPATAGVRNATIRRLTPRQAFIELLRNTFNRDVKDPARLEQLFRHAAWLSASVPVKLLRYPRDLKTLTALHDVIRVDTTTDSTVSVSAVSAIDPRERLAG